MRPATPESPETCVLLARTRHDARSRLRMRGFLEVPDPILVTIPISHFCEKARWALDRAGVAYEERPHVQVIHRFAARRAGGGSTVPVFVRSNGAVLTESA